MRSCSIWVSKMHTDSGSQWVTAFFFSWFRSKAIWFWVSWKICSNVSSSWSIVASWFRNLVKFYFLWVKSSLPPPFRLPKLRIVGSSGVTCSWSYVIKPNALFDPAVFLLFDLLLVGLAGSTYYELYIACQISGFALALSACWWPYLILLFVFSI